MPITVIDTITPKTATFPVAVDSNIQGGFQVCPTVAAMNAIPLNNQKVGMLVYVTAGGGFYYQLSVVGSPGTWVSANLGGTGGGAIVFSPTSNVPSTTIISARSVNQSPTTGSLTGATNLGNDTSGMTTGVSGNFAVVLGGDQNIASNNYDITVGGLQNKAIGGQSFIGGGFDNIAVGPNSTITGGSGNLASGHVASVSGGGFPGNSAVGQSSTIAGGTTNTTFGLSATIAGGATNNASGDNSNVSGGSTNTVGMVPVAFTIVAGGVTVTIVGDVTSQFISGDGVTIQPITPIITTSNPTLIVETVPVFNGVNTIFNLSGTIDTTTTGGLIVDTAIGHLAHIGGGGPNIAHSEESTIGGGVNHFAVGTQVTIGGGGGNKGTTQSATVAGGGQDTAGNWATNIGATVGGGGETTINVAYGQGSTCAGGDGNSACGTFSVVSGGASNNAGFPPVAFILSDGAGGIHVQIAGNVTTQFNNGDVVNIQPTTPEIAQSSQLAVASVPTFNAGPNTTTFTLSGTLESGTLVPGGQGWGNLGRTTGGFIVDNTIATQATIGGGNGNNAIGIQSTIGGGLSNAASGNQSTIGGGANNTASGSGATCAGGESCQANATTAFIGGGQSNTTTGSQAVICGGVTNTSSANQSFIGGGANNNCSGSGQAVICGGMSNVSNSQNSTVCGGANNQATNSFATICGGYSNIASGSLAFVGSGRSNTASGEASCISGGIWGLAKRTGQNTHSSSTFDGVSGDYQTSLMSLIGTTPGNNTGTETAVLLYGENPSSELLLLDNHKNYFMSVEAIITASVSGTMKCVLWKFQAALRCTSSTIVVAGTGQAGLVSDGDASLKTTITSLAFAPSGNLANLTLTTTGVYACTILAKVRFTEVIGTGN